MRAWLALVASSFRKRLAYRSNIVYGALWLLLELFIQVTIWVALYRGHDTVSGVTLSEMITYIVIVNLSQLAGRAYGGESVEDRVKSGEISTDLLLPVDYRVVLALENVGGILFQVVVSGVPLVVAASLFLRVAGPASAWHLLAFVVTVAGAFLVSMCLEIVKGAMAFWAMRPGTLDWIFDGLSAVFGGAIVPLWFFPEWMLKIAEFLPFRLTQFVPAAVYLGRFETSALPGIVAQQALWIAGLLLLQAVLWRRGLRRLTIYGG
jgi:ABC-2 type transport system permease protein